jgi:hypothetical protein
MNAPRDNIPEVGAETYLFASGNGSHITWLTDALSRLGSVVVLGPDTKSIDERIALLGPVAVFIDFLARPERDRGPAAPAPEARLARVARARHRRFDRACRHARRAACGRGRFRRHVGRPLRMR